MNLRNLLIGLWLASFLFPTTLLCQVSSPLLTLQENASEIERTEVMVLGTFHFRTLGKSFRPSLVLHLLERLEAFKPDVIAVEVLPGPRVHELEARGKATSVHGILLENFASLSLELGREAQALLKMDNLQASQELAAQKSPPQDSSSWQRQTLLHLASYQWPNALLAWSRVSPEDRGGNTLVPPALSSKLESRRTHSDEVVALALPLALRLNHREIAGVDDFEDCEATELILEREVFRSRENPLIKAARNAEAYRRVQSLQEEGLKTGDLLPVFRYMNGPAYAAADVEAQWGVLLRTRYQDRSDRSRLALWENRNMKIAASIRALSSRYPGKRILVIYGAAHKPFLDAYLGGCSDIRVVQPLNFLEGKP